MRKSIQKPSQAASASNVGAKCQKCLKEGHWTADCTNERVYKPRPSRTALLFNPKLKLPEASMVKDDFIEEKDLKRNDTQVNEEVEDITYADTFANLLIEEVKMAHKINEAGISEAEDSREYHSRRRRRSLSPSRSISRSRHGRSTSRSRSPRLYRSKRWPSVEHEIAPRVEKSEKKYTDYASDSDFSSDSD